MSYCNATEPTFNELIKLQQFGGYISFFGVLLLIPLFISKLMVPRFRQFPSRLSTLFVAASLGWNITIVIGAITQNWKQLWLAKLQKQKSTTFCKIQGILVQFFISIQILLWLEITIGMYLLIIKKKTFHDISKYEKYFHLFWIIGGILMTIPAFIWEPVPQLGTSYCWLTDDYDFIIQISFLHCEMFLALIFGSFLLSKVLYKLFKISASVDLVGNEGSTTKQVIQSYVWRHAMFLQAFGVVFFIAALFVTNQIMNRFNLWCMHLPMAYFHSVAVSGSGITSFLVLSRIEYYQTARNHMMCCSKNNNNETKHLLLSDSFDGTTRDGTTRDEESFQ